MNYKKQSACLGMAFAALTLAACGGKAPQTGKAGSPPPVDLNSAQGIEIRRTLTEIAGEANQAAPATIDPNTRLDSAKAGPGLKLTTTYTLVNAESQGIDSTTFDAKLTPIVKKASCENPELRPLINQGVVVVLEYRGKDGKPIGTVNINHDTCTTLK